MNAAAVLSCSKYNQADIYYYTPDCPMEALLMNHFALMARFNAWVNDRFYRLAGNK